jgi:fibronectin-binding autotransporter adhesin
MAQHALCQTANVGVIANDNAGNDQLPAQTGSGTTNGGFGMGAWNSFNFGSTSNNGTFNGDPRNNGNGGGTSNLIGTNAWGMYDNNGAVVGDFRNFTNGLQIGQSVSIDFDSGFIDNTKRKEIIVFSTGTGGSDRLSVGFTGGASNYNTLIGTGANFNQGFSQNDVHITITLTGTNTFSATIGTAGTTDVVTGTLGGTAGTGVGAILGGITIKENDTTSGSSHDFFTNNIYEYTPTVIAAGNLNTSAVYSGGNSRIATQGSSLNFDGPAGGTVTNNYLNTIYNIAFNATASGANSNGTTNAASYTLTGNGTGTSVTLNGGVDNNSSNLQTINSNLKLGGGQSFNATNGDLSFGGTIDFNSAGSVILSTSGSHNVTFGGSFLNVPNGSDVLKTTGSGTITVSGDNSASTVNHLMFNIVNGTLSVANANNLGAPTLTGTTTYPDKVVFGDTSGTNTATLKATGSFSFGATGTNAYGFSINQTSAGTGNTAVIDVTGSNTFTLNGGIRDQGTGTVGQFQKADTGTLILNAANTYTGATTINSGGGTLNVAVANALGSTSTVTVNSSGTLLLSGSSSVTDRINNSATVTLNGGGTFNTGGLSEGTRPTNSSSTDGAAGMGALTLQNTTSLSHAVFNFGVANTGSSLVFSGLTAGSKGAFVDILNWVGAANTDNSATGNDRLLFVGDPGFTATDLANFAFNGFATGAIEIPYGKAGSTTIFEIVPIPEPGTWLAGGLALIGLFAVSRRRLSRIMEAEIRSRNFPDKL